MKTNRIILTAIGFITATLLFSCEESSTSDLQDVQLCLNKAEQGGAASCVQKISGDTSPLAYSLRCSAIFIDQGFGDAASFVDALDNLNGGSNGCGGSCSSTVSALTALKFDSAGIDAAGQAANNAAAAEAFTQCSQADAKIYTQIASLFQLGTLTSMAAIAAGPGTGPGGSYTEADLAAVLPTLTPAIVGTIVTVTYQNTCSDTENASDSTQAYCGELQAAIDGGATIPDIGSCLLNKLANPAYVCP